MTKEKQPMKAMPIDAGNGRIVSKEYAKAHPDTTVILRVPLVKPGKAKP